MFFQESDRVRSFGRKVERHMPGMKIGYAERSRSTRNLKAIEFVPLFYQWFHRLTILSPLAVSDSNDKAPSTCKVQASATRGPHCMDRGRFVPDDYPIE